MLWTKQAPCHQRSTDSREQELEGRAGICMVSEDSQVLSSFPKFLWGGADGLRSYLVPLPWEQGRQVWWDEFRTTQVKLPEVASEQALYQAVKGGLQNGLKAPPVRMLQRKQEKHPWKRDREISPALSWEYVRQWKGQSLPCYSRHPEQLLHSEFNKPLQLSSRQKDKHRVLYREEIRAFKCQYEYLAVTSRRKNPLR